MNPAQVFLANNFSGAGPTSPVFFPGGTAAFECNTPTGATTATLQKLGPDGATYETVGAPTTVSAAAFVQGLNLPAGVYRMTFGASVTAFFATLSASLD